MSRTAIVAGYCEGFVLTGGRSTRMGQDKALMEVRGTALASMVARNMVRAVQSATLVGSRVRHGGLGLPVIEDQHTGLGPLSGIHAALKHTRKPLALVAGCDMPFLSWMFLEHIAEIASVADADVTVAESGEFGYESLCAVYNRSALSAVEEAITRGELKLSDLYKSLRVRTVSAEECRPFNKFGVLFSNVNTPDDFEQARLRLEAMTKTA